VAVERRAPTRREAMADLLFPCASAATADSKYHSAIRPAPWPLRPRPPRANYDHVTRLPHAPVPRRCIVVKSYV